MPLRRVRSIRDGDRVFDNRWYIGKKFRHENGFLANIQPYFWSVQRDTKEPDVCPQSQFYFRTRTIDVGVEIRLEWLYGISSEHLLLPLMPYPYYT